jgi:hypothetical protein
MLKPNVLIEIKRYILIKKIIKKIEIKTNKHNLSVSNIISHWIMLNIDKGSDPLFPSTIINNKQIIRDFQLANPKIKTNLEARYIIKKLKIVNLFKNAINKIINFQQTIKNYHKINVIYENEKMFIENYDLKLDVHKELYNKLCKKLGYVDNELIFILILRYKSLDSSNQQLAVNPNFYIELNKTLGFNFELFGSAINTTTDHYCSLFYDIEKYFGSKGSFFKYKLISGLYVCNPPYDELIMKNMAKKLIKSLDEIEDPLTILVIIPCWDRNEDKYGKFHTLDLIQNSPYVVFIKKVFKRNTRFFNHLLNQTINPVDVYFILLQNKSTEVNYGNIILNSMKKYFIK